MASTATAGVNGTGNADLTAAERLMQQHEAHEFHKPTVEEVIDEETLAHPPPSAHLPQTNGNISVFEAPSSGVMSEKAAGKQPARETAPQATPGAARLDTSSEDLFPALGAPKSAAASATPSMWSKKPSVAAGVNGVGTKNGLPNGTARAPSAETTSSTKTPASIPGAVNSSAASALGQRTPQMSLPGRNVETITLHQSMLKRRDELKKPIAEILRDINKRSKATIEMKPGPSGTMIFSGIGATEPVRIALKEVASQLCASQKIKVPVPVSTRGKVVGKQGATIQAIQKSSGARIQISKQDATDAIDDDDDSATADVVIEGDPFAVQMAKQEVERIVNENTSSVNARLKHVPAEYYPFLTARTNHLRDDRDLKLHIPPYRQWSEQAPLQTPANRGAVSFTPQAALPIQLSGDRQAVAQARTEIDQLVAQLQQELTMEQTMVERGRHQFIVGDMGSSLDDFMAETGCSIILPPDSHDSEDLYIVGPPDRIEDGINKVMELATSMQSASADIARQHAAAAKDAQAHARAVTRYLQQKQVIEELERQHSARIVPDNYGQWQIYARDGKNAMKARSDIMNLISGHPPSRFAPLDVDPFYHEHLRKRAAKQVRDDHGVVMVVPASSEGGPIMLVYEDKAPSPDYDLPRKAPTSQEGHAFQQALEAAQREILGLISGQQEILSREVEAPAKYHDKIRRHVDRHHQSLRNNQIPVQVLYGNATGGDRRTQAPSLNLRGPPDAVDVLAQSLLAFIEQEKIDETERGFTLDFDVPQKHASHLIGKGGENINRLREEFDVDIQLGDGKCVVKGPEAKANAAKKHILDVAKKLDDEKTHHLNIAPAFHRELIGHQGSQVNRLQERYGVRVQFPRTRQQGDDTASEADDAPSRRPNQQPNEVVVKGPSRAADQCRDEILSLLQYLKDNSFSSTVSVAQSQLPSLIGAEGREMDALRLESGAQIDVPSAKDVVAGGRAEIKIRGSKQAVDLAKKLIEEKAKVFDNTTIRHLDVDRRHHRLIIGPQGSTLTSLIEQAKGPTDARGRARIVRFPKTAEEGNSIRLEGQKAVVDKLCDIILALVGEQESQTTEIAEVKPDKHRVLIGRGGESKRQLEQQFGVSINVPRQNETGPQRSQVKITGQPEKVEKCKAHILQLTKEQDGETVEVPRKYHHAVADNGQFFRRLRNDYKVTVDHSGVRPPPRPAAPTPTRANGNAMPLITDDASTAADTHAFEVHGLTSNGENGTIPWVLTGPSPESITAARAKLDKALQEAFQRDTMGFLILPDPRAYRHVIGPGGSEINRIRAKSNTKIQVPRDQNQGEAIEIVGTMAGVEEARDLILEIVRRNA